MPSKILIVDHVANNRSALRVKLVEAYYDVVEACSGAVALSVCERDHPDLVIVSSDLPGMDFESFCKKIKAVETDRDLPVLLILPAIDRKALISGLSCGADQVLFHPVSDQLLFAQLRALIRGRNSAEELFLRDKSNRAAGFCEPAAPFISALRIGIVADNTRFARRWQSKLRLPTQHKLSHHAPRSLMRDIETQGVPDILVIGIDADYPENGLSLLAGLSAQLNMRSTTFLAVIENGNDTLAAEALDLGANDLLLHGFESKEAILRLSRLAQRKNLADSMKHTVRNGLRAALIDPLTGLHNRRHALPQLSKMVEAAQTGKEPLAVMIADIDHFKQINDTFGHSAGDEVLKSVARRLEDGLMGTCDLLARIGGEEFLIALPNLPLNEARLTARRLCAAISATPFDLPELGETIPVTISIGLSLGGGANAQQMPSATLLMEQADQALYSAKSDGRNQVMVSRPAA